MRFGRRNRADQAKSVPPGSAARRFRAGPSESPKPFRGCIVGSAQLRERDMPVSSTNVIERIARVIAGRVASINADGEDASAGDRVDETWQDYRDDALSILRTLREPDPAMAEAGEVETWKRMIEAALAEAGD
jgi:hypothetical protein